MVRNKIYERYIVTCFVCSSGRSHLVCKSVPLFVVCKSVLFVCCILSTHFILLSPLTLPTLTLHPSVTLKSLPNSLYSNPFTDRPPPYKIRPPCRSRFRDSTLTRTVQVLYLSSGRTDLVPLEGPVCPLPRLSLVSGVIHS